MRLFARFFLSCFAATVIAVGTAGQAREPLVFGGAISWVLQPVPISVESGTSRAKLGDFVFVQPFRPASEVIPGPGQTALLPGILGKKTPVPLDGQRLIAATGSDRGISYCTVERVTKKGQRLCFVDTDADGRFDFQCGAFGIGNGEPFSQMVNVGTLPAAIQYTVKQSASDALLAAGMLVRKEGNGYAMKIAVSEKGRPKILNRVETDGPFRARKLKDNNAKFTAQQLPLKFEFYGAAIEIIAISEDEVTYRLTRGFDPAEPVIVSRAGSLPILR